MSWFSEVWTWIAQHPITVIVVAVGLTVVAIAVVWLCRLLRVQRVESVAVEPAQDARSAKTSSHGVTGAYSIPSPDGLADAAYEEPREPSPPHPRKTFGRSAQPASAAPPASTTPDAEPPVHASTWRTREERTDLGALASRKPDPSTSEGALAIEAGRLAYQVPERMWLGVQETVEVRLGTLLADELMQGFVGRGDIKLEDVPIVETMSVSLVCEPGAFDIETRSQEVQLVKPDLVKGTAFHQSDFARWTWLVTPRRRGKHTLLVKVSAALRDSRGLPTTSSLPDKIIAVTVRVHLARAAVGAVGYLAPLIASGVVTALVGIFTKDYWWPAIRAWLGL